MSKKSNCYVFRTDVFNDGTYTYACNFFPITMHGGVNNLATSANIESIDDENILTASTLSEARKIKKDYQLTDFIITPIYKKSLVDKIVEGCR
jgi:hypothetical protein